MSKWTFTDTAVVPTETYTFAINANLDVEDHEKTLTIQTVLIPGTLPLIYEGHDQPTSLTLNGTSLSKGQQQTFLSWFGKRHQVLLADDRGYQRWVYPKSFKATRKPSALYPWRCDWEMDLILMSATFPA